MSPIRVLALFLVAGHAVAAVPVPPTLRLFRDVTPTRYRASLVITPGNPRFSGNLTIQLKLDKATDQIWINSEELSINFATVSVGQQQLKAQIVSDVKGFAGFLLARPVQPGSAVLELNYVGTVISKPGPGLSSSSRNHSYYAVTHFEPIAARRVFPCFDEPNFKVPWQLTIDAPAKDMVVSNTSVESDTTKDGRHRVVFRETKPLPSYLVAFTIGEYEALELGKVGRNHTPVRVIIPRGDRDKASFALKIVPKIVEQLESYFDVGYPYEKLDQVAVPNYPENSAMEDAGSILYDESRILCRPEALTHETEESILWLIIHETAHQWFGNLVTLAWWNDTWLNEGLTEWLQWKLQSDWGAEWRDDLSAIEDLDHLVHQDIRPVAHPIRQRIETPGQIETELDDITYFKTAEVLQMMERYLGPEVLKKSIRSYLRAHLFGNATGKDFSDELARADPGAAASFEQYLDRTGLPQLGVALDCSQAKPVVHLRQETFRPFGVTPSRTDPWIFPVCIGYSNDRTTKNTCILMKDTTTDLQLAESKCPVWLVANQGASGYYITQYDQPTFKKLARNLRSLSSLDQVHTLWETSLLVRNGKQPPSVLLDTLRAFGSLSNVPDLLAAIRFSEALSRYGTSPEAYKRLTSYFEKTFGKAGRDLGWAPPAGASDKQREDCLRAVSQIAILGEDKALIGSAQKLAADWLRDRNSIRADVAGPALQVAGRFAIEEFYSQLLRAANEEHDYGNRMNAINGLALVGDPSLIRRNFDLFSAGTFPLNESLMLFLGPILNGPAAIRRMPLEFLREHTIQVRSLFPKPLGRDYSDFFINSTSTLCSEEDRKLAQLVVTPILAPEAGGDQRLAEALDSIKLCTVAREATETDFIERVGIER